MFKGTLAIAAFLGHLRCCNDAGTMKCILVYLFQTVTTHYTRTVKNFVAFNIFSNSFCMFVCKNFDNKGPDEWQTVSRPHNIWSYIDKRSEILLFWMKNLTE